MEDINLNIGESFYEVFDFDKTVNRLRLLEIYFSGSVAFYKCIKEDYTTEDVQYWMFMARLEAGYYFLNYNEAVAKFNRRIDVKIDKLQKKITKLEAAKIK